MRSRHNRGDVACSCRRAVARVSRDRALQRASVASAEPGPSSAANACTRARHGPSALQSSLQGREHAIRRHDARLLHCVSQSDRRQPPCIPRGTSSPELLPGSLHTPQSKGRREGRVPAGTRGLLREDVAQRDRTAAYRCSRTHGLPCAVVGRLMPCSPGSRVPSGLPRPRGIHRHRARLAPMPHLRKSLAVATTARTTRFCRTQQSCHSPKASQDKAPLRTTRLAGRSSARGLGLTATTRPALASRARRCRVHRKPDPRLVTTYDRPFADQPDGRHIRQIRISVKWNIFTGCGD